MKKTLLIIGYQAYDERMYPHLYDFLHAMEREFYVRYWGEDQRGEDLVLLNRFIQNIWTESHKLKQLLRCGNYVMKFISRLVRRRQAFKQYLRNRPDVIIAIDHAALNWAARYAEPAIPLLFWSHDMIHIDEQRYHYPLVRRMIARNRKVLRQCAGIMIQDYYRGALLDALLGAPHLPKFYFPVSLADDAHARQVAQTKAEQQHLEAIRIMQIKFDERRGSIDLLEAYQHLSESITVCFQGGSARTEAILADYPRKAEYAPMQPSFAKMREYIATADIGVLCYRVRDLNHLFLSNASGQMVEFLRFGIPIIVLEHDELGRTIEYAQAGVFITQIDGLMQAIETIQRDYARYSRQARALYTSRYEIAGYSRALGQFLTNIA